MPKVNVYLPDELAEAVKDAGVPVSAICQHALEQSVKRVTAIRSATVGDLATEDPTASLSHFTERARNTIKRAIGQARAAKALSVGSEHLLYGILAEEGNLALHVLRALEVEPEQVRQALAHEPAATAGEPAARFSGPAANALELTVTEAISLGHNYVGCEHLLLGLLGEPDGTAGRVLRGLGLDQRSARRTVVAALSGYAHLRAKTDPASMITAVVRQELAPLVARIERLEQR
ncbi:ATP-dependent Clp protease ATP-binding subunit [Amycolatopsis sp. K13G38]|uniref:ATP-dependent Clp protease ATP-binding subunit n=1 Tax=Amycolatopsis acididurans TaxID=2724524 RepID=A0ABX1JEW1_9PSEU|nr:Clp protease N-terminal domain-containing protein [Amycolatopsis acididurans]NKQ58289.1 ATP-dependent Clp protease ATP-binding subunit [Amycolatopsis acididurans]